MYQEQVNDKFLISFTAPPSLDSNFVLILLDAVWKPTLKLENHWENHEVCMPQSLLSIHLMMKILDSDTSSDVTALKNSCSETTHVLMLCWCYSAFSKETYLHRWWAGGCFWQTCERDWHVCLFYDSMKALSKLVDLKLSIYNLMMKQNGFWHLFWRISIEEFLFWLPIVILVNSWL